MNGLNRREFLGGLAAASAFTIVPRRVLGGRGYRAPSDMILLAQVGCGTQAQRQVNTGMVRHPDLQFVAVVDPNRDSSNYVDWSPNGNRGTIRRFLEEPTWSQGDGIRAGREVAKEIMEIYYRKQQRPSAGIRAYEDYREMLEKEPDIQGIVNITPDHQHASINISALRKGKAVIAHKPVAHIVVRTASHAGSGSREVSDHALCSPTATRRTGTPWPRGSTRASSDTSAKCTTGRIDRSGRKAGRNTTHLDRQCRPASTGSSGRARNRIGPITRTTRSRSIAAGMRTAPAA